MTQEEAQQLAIIIINELEGGYYHPDMKSKLRGGEAMMDSGETMYGLDRKAGAPATTVGTSQEAFWRIIDKYYGTHHGDTLYYNDKAEGRRPDIPAAVGVELKRHAANIIMQSFNKYSAKLDPAAKEKILQDPALLLQFFYGVYNGPVAFNKFANVMNDAYSKGTRDAKKLYNLLQTERRKMGSGTYGNKLYNIGADKIDNIIKKYYGLDYADGASNGWLWILAAAGVAFYLFKKK